MVTCYIILLLNWFLASDTKFFLKTFVGDTTFLFSKVIDAVSGSSAKNLYPSALYNSYENFVPCANKI